MLKYQRDPKGGTKEDEPWSLRPSSTCVHLLYHLQRGTSYPWRIHGAGIYANIKGIQYIDGIHGTPNI